MSDQILDLGEQNTLVHQQRCGLATASLICSIIICCPLVTLIGVILGIVALLRIRASKMTGKGLAWAGIIIGLIATILSSLFITFAVVVAFSVIEQTPEKVTVAITAGISEDIATFRSVFEQGALSATDEEITTFIQSLTDRYGKFDKAVIDTEEMQGLESSNNGAELPIQLVFETKTVSSTVAISIVQGSGSLIDIQIKCLTIHDASQGDLAFPRASICGSSIPATNPTDEK